MQVLITGGSGFIGQNLCQELLRNGMHPIVLTRVPNRTAKIFSQHEVDILSYDDDLPPCEVVINLAGESIAAKILSEKRRQEILNSRLKVIAHLKKKLKHFPPELFIQASATGIYAQNQDCDEGGITDSNFYAKTCLCLEESAKEAFDKTAIARIGVVLGNGGGLYRITKRLPPFRIIGANNTLPWISLADTVKALSFITAYGKCAIFNLVSPDILTCNQILSQSY